MSKETESLLSPPPIKRNTSRQTVWLLVGLYAIAVLWGLRSIYRDKPTMLDFFLPLGFAACLGLWAVTDARRRRHPIPLLAQPWFFLLAGIVVPCYVIWSRNWQGLAWLVLHAILLFVVATAALHIGGVIVYGEAWLKSIGL